MYSTKDYLRAEPWQAVINRINEVYLTELTAYTTKLVSIESLGGTQTKIVIEPNISESDRNTMPEVTRTEYIYDRLDLAAFFPVPAPASIGGYRLPISTFDVLGQIAELNDIEFTLNDFQHYQFDEYNQTYSLKANPKSLRFVGEFTFKLINTTKELIQNQGNKLEHPTANATPLGTIAGMIVGQYTTSGYDFTDQRELLIELKPGVIWPIGKKVAAMLEDVTGYPWVCDSLAKPWNIAGEVISGEARPSVLYNGIVLPRYTPRTDMQRVCVIRLSTLANNVSGYLLLHYN